ncbi:TIGR01777 family oxidoreductase [Microbacterium excoecariae]|uniref:TIGR01777 family oxidoreductase n=1 Tax=Microbacterium excoecariae TaxID=2715210 RepID=UPI00140979D6|nr:TIGR01777 family oxidoreductase [Microbacterium excoecariae]NHI16567.1 TIGR01777 family protein [Microbacterium excoecariae]
MRADRIVVAGSSGLIGQALVRSLATDGIPVSRLVRRPPKHPDEIAWSPGERHLDPAVLARAAAVVSLGGASIGRLPWTPRYRRELVSSRLAPTRTLARALGALGTEAPAFVSASAVGFYGDRPGETLAESSGPGDTFLARLCDEWEKAAAGSAPRVAFLRTAPLLHPRGVLKPMMLLARAGVSGPLGRGTQVWPWISLEDEVRAIRHVIDRGLSGPVNLTGPTLATANNIGRALAARVHRPYLLPAPAWALRFGLGRDAADSLLLADAAVRPAALLDSGFTFTHATATEAIAAAVR